MSLGKVKKWGSVEKLATGGEEGGVSGNSKLGGVVLKWLKEDLAERGPRNKQASEGKSYASEGIGGYGFEVKA